MELNFKAYGQGFPVVILHGLFGSLDNWQTVAKMLAKTYSVFTLDQRNHGRSPHSEEFSLELLAEDLRAWMESQHIYEAHLIGHSMGGKTAMRFSVDHADMVDKLVVVDMAPTRYPRGHDQIFDALLTVDFRTAASRSDVDNQLKPYISQTGVRQFLMKGLTRNADRTFRWKFNLDALYRHYDEILVAIESEQPIDLNALFIRGERSNYINIENSPYIKALFPNSAIQTIPSAGHWVHAEAPLEFVDAVTSFLQ